MNGPVIDPILLSVIERRMDAITKEMGLTLLRTTRSPVFNESRDFATAIYDPAANLIVQTEYIPILAFAIQPALKAVIDYFGDEVYPGDVIIHNDVYSGSNQSQDVSVFRPIFYQGRLMYWAATKGHHTDLGGAALGGYSPASREIWAESFRIPPLKVHERGKPRRDVWDLIKANSRMAKVVSGELAAQIGACVVGERGMVRLLDRYGADVLNHHLRALLDSTEKRMREEIRRIPDGVYTGMAQTDHNGLDLERPCTVKVTITVKDDELIYDFSGTDPQQPTYVNGPLATTLSVTALTTFMLVDPGMPHNSGALRPVTIHVPEGCILNPRFPAPTAHGNFTCNDTIPEATFKALAEVLPEKVTAGWQRWCSGPMAGIDPRSGARYVDTPFLAAKGGGGAASGADGWSHIGMIGCAGGVRAQDYEIFELQDPHTLIQHEYWPDSAGPGRWRGGWGVRTLFEVYGEGVVANLHGDGMKPENAPFGLFGGRAGKPNSIYYHFSNGEVVKSDSKQNFPIPKGTVVEYLVSGGGGYGHPFERAAELVRQEARNGLISVESARQDYGVALHPETLEIDRSETARLRGRQP